MLFWHGIPLGVDFRGGTLVYVKFSHPPDDERDPRGIGKVGLTQSQDTGLRRSLRTTKC